MPCYLLRGCTLSGGLPKRRRRSIFLSGATVLASKIYNSERCDPERTALLMVEQLIGDDVENKSQSGKAAQDYRQRR
ncbi:hypothetical protein PC122_g15379 [Phytophthora cactorum]|nr:hypothetical protein PC122_g15379 [Phytophthora cactorum]